MALITKQDFDSLNIGLPAGVNSSKLNKAIREAEDNDLSNYFDPEFLYDLKLNSTDQIYKDLLEGKVYKISTYDLEFKGMKSALVYFAYSRLITSINQTISDNSYVQKTSEYSIPVNTKVIAMDVLEAERMAKFYMADVIRYMEHNSSVYVRYRCKRKKMNFRVLDGNE